MIDVHSHIVFGVDDGAKEIEQSAKMLQEAKEAGFHKIIVTPHYMEEYYECNKKEIAEKIEQIREKMPIDMQIFQGNEIYITNRINSLLEEEKATTLNNSQYVLFELPINAEPFNITEVVYQILEQGRVPILAHPERYPYIQKNPNKLIPLIEDGVLMQCNYGSIIGIYGKEPKETIKKLLEHHMVHFLGSDTHRPNTIYPRIPQAIEEINKIVGEEEQKLLTTVHPEAIIQNQKIEEIENPIPIKKKSFFKLFN